MSDRWVDQALPECAQGQGDLVDEELTRREAELQYYKQAYHGVISDISILKAENIALLKRGDRWKRKFKALKNRGK